MPSAFLDTNILIYAAAGTRSDPERAEISRAIIADGDFGLSFQVLQEFYVNLRKLPAPLADAEIDEWISNLLLFDCVSGDPQLFLEAVVVSRTYRISYWDGAIVAAANRLDVSTLFTEDLNNGQTYGQVRAVNPFAQT
ncbi:MAG: PIN domain-containing protein [Pseudomonadota bacterium]